MANFLGYLENPIFNYERIYEVIRDFHKGGLNPTNYDEFLETVKQLPSLYERQHSDYSVFAKFNLIDLSESDYKTVMREVMLRGIEKSKFCWHPNASDTTCNMDKSGKIIITAAHSIQNNGILSKIVENGQVMSYAFERGKIDGEELHKNHASIFWGFCNTHDAIFSPIEINPYIGTDEQNFLFAYRGFIVSSHKKIEVSNWMNYPEQSNKDIVENKKIFDNAILTNDFSFLETEVFVLPAFYPIAVSSSFYLDFDFNGKVIPHSEDKRMEDIYVTLLPVDNKTYFLLSYFKEDKHLYGNIGEQIKKRNKLKSDITILVAAHAANVYFNPTYYKTFIEQHEKIILQLIRETQFDNVHIGEGDKLTVNYSLTPDNYLDIIYDINFFGY